MFSAAAIDAGDRNAYQLGILVAAAEGETSVRFTAASADAQLPTLARALRADGFRLAAPLK